MTLPQHEVCERCGVPEDVRWLDECPRCDPAPLCAFCRRLRADLCAETHGGGFLADLTPYPKAVGS